MLNTKIGMITYTVKDMVEILKVKPEAVKWHQKKGNVAKKVNFRYSLLLWQFVFLYLFINFVILVCKTIDEILIIYALM